METNNTPTRESLIEELAAAKAEVNSLRALIYQPHNGGSARTLSTEADVDDLLTYARAALLNRIEAAGTICNATLILQCDIV